MELLLNLAWMLLAVPAYWLWRGSRSARAGNKFSSLQCLLALASVLVLLFPVISATDDLHAMRAEIEETPASKRTLRVSSDKTSTWSATWQSPALAASSGHMFVVHDESWQKVSAPLVRVIAAPVVLRIGRAPPFSCLA